MNISRRILATAALIAGVGLALGLAPQNTPAAASATYKIDAVHSTALFRVHHLGAGQFYGRFNDVQGTVDFAEGTEDLSFDVTIPIESVDTNNDQLDGHLKSPDFFNAKEFPTMTFESSSAHRKSGQHYEVKGNLTIHGVTRAITADVEWTGSADFGRGYRSGFEATFTINRSDYQVMYGVTQGFLGDETRIIVSLEAIRQDS